MGEDTLGLVSILPQGVGGARAFSTSVFLDTENVFFWADDSPRLVDQELPGYYKNRRAALDKVFSTAFGYLPDQDDELAVDALMRLARPVLGALTTWLADRFGPFDLRSYGKPVDPASRALSRALKRNWLHVGVSSDPDAADIALVKDLEDRVRRRPKQVFIVCSSDLAKVINWTKLLAKSAPQHEYHILLGPNLFSTWNHAPLNYLGSISEIFGQVVMAKKGGSSSPAVLSSDDTDRMDRFNRSMLPTAELKYQLLRAKSSEQFGNSLVWRADTVGGIPSHWSGKAYENTRLWWQACLDAWQDPEARHQGDRRVPDYIEPREIARLMDRCRSALGGFIVFEIIDHALGAINPVDAHDRRRVLIDAFNRAMARTGSPGMYL